MEYQKKNLVLAVLVDVKNQLDMVAHAVNDSNDRRAIDTLTGVLGMIETAAGVLSLPTLESKDSE
jgi:hypothetical protein